MAGANLVSRPVPNGFSGPQVAPVMGSAPSANEAPGGGDSTSFLLWVVFFGLVLPAVVLGGLRAGGFRFVFVGK